MSPFYVLASQECTSLSLDLDPRRMEACRIQSQEDMLSWEGRAGRPSPHEACGHLATCVYQMALYRSGR